MPSRTYSRVKSSAFKIWSFHCNKSISIGTRPQDLSSGLRPMQHSISFKTFRIEEYNYYMDNFAKKRDPKIMEGTLTDEEFASLKPILQKCNFFKMKDSYGFEEETNRDLGDIMYQVSFTTEGKEKFISIRNSDTGQFSASFVKLIGFINTFLNNHKND